MTSAAWALQKAIHAQLAVDTGLLALLGSARIFDDVPRGSPFPYITFAAMSERDWSTGSEAGSEHIVALNIWSSAAGRHEVDAIASAVRSALHDQTLTLTDHRLINMRHETTDLRREADGESYRAVVRLRGVTEPDG
jgi:hypothetical protein